jgi:hypothetical protein
MKTLYHIQVAKAAFEPWLTPRGLDWVLRGNFNTDFYGSMGWMILLKGVSPLYFAARHWYKGIDHMDQMDSVTDIADKWNELRRRLRAVADDSEYKPTQVKKMFIQLGRNSHSLTDIYAHSNYVELLFGYYGADPRATELVAQSGLPLWKYIAEHGPTFSELIDNQDEWRDLMVKHMAPGLFCAQAVPDEGPRSHDAINKDTPVAARSQDPAYPGIFKAVMALAHRDVVSIVNEFFLDLKERNTLKFTMLTQAFPGDMPEPGAFEKRAIFWSQIFKGWD